MDFAYRLIDCLVGVDLVVVSELLPSSEQMRIIVLSSVTLKVPYLQVPLAYSVKNRTRFEAIM